LLVALDGTDSFSSEKISCTCCTQQNIVSPHGSHASHRRTLAKPRAAFAAGSGQTVA
jgi:hypothetical protein